MCYFRKCSKDRKSASEQKHLFIPDRNLAHFIAEQVPEKNFIYNEGFCIVHEFMDPEEVKAAKKRTRMHWFWHIRNVRRQF